jgi:hypothetical protein
MSILSDFIKSVSLPAQEVIGQVSLTISGGAIIYGISGQSDETREYCEGFEQFGLFDFVVDTDIFIAAYPKRATEYFGLIATIRDEKWRVKSIQKGQFFTRIGLVDPDKST